jgi:uncharacterized surface protein with fasciclin (FAS1) repeats
MQANQSSFRANQPSRSFGLSFEESAYLLLINRCCEFAQHLLLQLNLCSPCGNEYIGRRFSNINSSSHPIAGKENRKSKNVELEINLSQFTVKNRFQPRFRPSRLKALASLVTLSGVSVLGLGGVALGHPVQVNPSGSIRESSNSSRYNLAELAVRTPSLSTLVSLASTCQLVDFLADPNTNATVFAPSNEAFSKFLGDKPLPETCSDDLKSILLYHIAIGKFSSEVFGKTKGFQTYLFPYSQEVEQVFVKSDHGAVRINRSSSVSSANIEASNGIVHIIDTVLIPDQIGTIVDALSKREQFETLVTAAVASRLETTLAVVPDLTLFAPVNDAFKAVGSPAPEVLKKVLLHHVLGSRVLAYQLVAGYQQAATLNRDSLTIFGGSDGFSIFGSGQTPIEAGRITATDVVTRNGVIHTISKVIVPDNVD